MKIREEVAQLRAFVEGLDPEEIPTFGGNPMLVVMLLEVHFFSTFFFKRSKIMESERKNNDPKESKRIIEKENDQKCW